MHKKYHTSLKIMSLGELLTQRAKWLERGDKVVFTNGSFDILHLGHIDFLEKAHNLGDRLIIGLHADSAVKRLRGEDRPVKDEYVRARILAALQFVDAIVIFGEDTPLELIKQIMPDILVKGSDYKVNEIVGADLVLGNGGMVETIDLVEGHSTTKTIVKMRKGVNGFNG